MLGVTLATNALPGGLSELAERLERPAKYSYIEHAERACLYRAARAGIATAGLTMVCPWATCADCARAIIACGITRLVRRGNVADSHPRWHDSRAIADQMLKEAQITVVNTTLAPAGLPQVLRNDHYFTPGNE
jgi:dCMP deaminase